MKKYRPFIVFLVSAIFTFCFIVFMSGCKNGPDGPTQTMWQIMETNENLSIVSRVADSVGLKDILATDGIYTFFAPGNSAMENLLGLLDLDDFTYLRNDLMREVLEYHMTNQKYLYAQLTDGQEIPTLQGENLTILSDLSIKEGILGEASTISRADAEATNGVVHIIDVVLFPPTLSQFVLGVAGTPALPLHIASDISIFGDGLKMADTYAETAGKPSLTSVLSNKFSGDRFTLFVPDNHVLDSLSITSDTYTGQEWYDLISHHIISGTEILQTFTPSDNHNTLGTVINGKTLTILSTDPDIEIDSNGDGLAEAKVTQLNAIPRLLNGTVHLINGVLLP